jgi:hypothetical protein
MKHTEITAESFIPCHAPGPLSAILTFLTVNCLCWHWHVPALTWPALFAVVLQVRKPTAAVQEVRHYLQQLDPQYLSRVVVHQHHDLAAEFALKVSIGIFITSILEHAQEMVKS